MSIVFEGKTYTQEALMDHVWDIEDIMELMNRRVFYMAKGLIMQELDDLWVKDPEYQATASFGGNYGFYRGMDEIRRYYSSRPNASKPGYSNIAPASTPVVVVAGDGKTAQGIWYSMAEETSDGKAIWNTGKIAADLVRENGEWKFWHIALGTDFVCGAGEHLDVQPRRYAPGEDPVQQAFGTPTISMLAHDTSFHWSDDWPPMPTDYETFTDSISYGPEGYRSNITRPKEAVIYE